jgi:hypothetical protein
METESGKVICDLLQTILEVALLGKPYPGQKAGTSFFPDIEIVKEIDEIVVSNRYLDDSCQIVVPGFRIKVLSDDAIVDRASSTGDFPFFSLTEAEVGTDEAVLSLQLTWAVSEESKRAGKLYLGGGGIHIKFERINGEWQTQSGPSSTWMA